MTQLREKIIEAVMPTCEDASSTPQEEAERLADKILSLPELQLVEQRRYRSNIEGDER